MSFFVSIQILVQEKAHIEVPSLMGMPIKEAEQTLDQLGLDLKVKEERFDPEYIPETIIHQSIAPMQKIPKGRKIFVIVSKTPSIDSMPKLVGTQLSLVKQSLSKLELNTVKLSYVCSEEVKNKILDQKPLFGQSSQGQEVSLLISEGRCSQEWVVGDVNAHSNSQLEETLRQRGIPSTSQNLSKLKKLKKGMLVSSSHFIVQASP
ncbi:MAG: PASTA domain-containing protein [Bdellovibrionales bacterium]|nr:PASTA domain-containing protein [Bdellovibrionales bacterium]